MAVGTVPMGYQITGYIVGGMIEEKVSPQGAAPMPSKAAILKATGIALGIALLILFVAVLPAEYGIDPLKTGAALGLTRLSRASAKPAAAAVPVPVQAGIFTPQPAGYKVSAEDLTLAPGEGVEIKYHMQKGAGMVYSWKADGLVQFEFHGEPDNKPNPDYFESYELDDEVGRDNSHGTFTAPTTGIHGWFWENKGKKEVTIHLTTAGFFDYARMFSDGSDGEYLTLDDPE
jgi:hypothetical protein